MPTDTSQYSNMLAELRAHFNGGLTRPLGWRREQLAALSRLLEENEGRLNEALAEDLGKPPQEVLLGETALLFSEIDHARRHLKSWTKRRRVRTPMVGKPGRSWVQPEPYGVVLIIGAWNYPVQLLLSPLIPALAAGNCAVLKPSEIAAATSRLLAELIPKYLDERAVRVVEGAVEETTELLKQHFDHIFYTGGAAVGRIIMRAAAEHLTPVTLELGGKSPCVIDAGADIESAARRLTWGKCLNAGQTCIAPDYVLVTPSERDKLIGAIEHELFEMYGSNRLESSDYCKIINRRHFDRLRNLLDSGRVVIGGKVDEENCRIEPTVMTEVAPDSAVMQEEIFGPILPILEVENLDEAIAFIRQRDKPLSSYLFTRSGESEQRFAELVSTGNLCINDTLMFMSVPDLPFGGVGMSGMGQYHGKAGFDRLSHLKAVMKRGRFPEIPVRFPPYSRFKMRLLKWFS
ncbi:aldehyde dehydrogenase family protein [Wenzhouxiangella sp. XN201]|uniref:aldehyde dehydrogenase family protein n=1 Tax=Wenzhouxiangella sp. XN201 TaxID=2710755 RepID=UPI0013CD3615|nr:aldehyde dehydrogenase family protein [Wenzhouxiangella sp. XN201]NEZ03599.1 aldehyde dehydrogenase family protein [Wenzhouxiangella sp. XN201]